MQSLPYNQQYILDMATKYAFGLILMTIACLNSLQINKQGTRQPRSTFLNQQSSSTLPRKIFSGEIHFSRIPHQYWQHRITTVKAMGLNSLSVYVMWNHHEIQKNSFDYQTDNRNIDYFLSLAEKHNMNVLLRPGPYVCAEWDFGGLPPRLYNVPNMKIRSNNPQFLAQTNIYFSSLSPIIKKHLKSQSNPQGCIILIQIQNQYGSYGSDLTYIQALRQLWSKLDIQCEQYHEDGASVLTRSHWQGANIGLSGGVTDNQYNYARSIQKKGMIFGGQIYTGWLTHWGQKWAKKSIEANIDQFKFLLTRNISFSMYMIHGGTNFGLTAGANSQNTKSDYHADVTSYDYDSPINQQGSITQKYLSLKSLLLEYVEWEVPKPPAAIQTISIPVFNVSAIASVLENLGVPSLQGTTKYYPFQSNELKMYRQGLVVYETNITKRVYYFKAVVHDYAIVVLDGSRVCILNRMENKQHNFTVNCSKQMCNLRIIVQAMGHSNYDHSMDNDIKGLFNLSDDLFMTFNWSHYKVPLDHPQDFLFKSRLLRQDTINLPVLYKANLSLQKTGDTYLDMLSLNKGYVWVNGRNLGRYWSIGPQKRLYCPGVWLKTGINEIYVLQLSGNAKSSYSIIGRQSLQQNFDQM